MLILTRKEGEGIRIGDNIVIKVTKITGNQVSLGVTAPRSVHVVRDELVPGYVVKGPPKEC